MVRYVEDDHDVLTVEFLEHYVGPETFEPAHTGDAGIDLYAANTTILLAGERVMVPCGIKLKLPVGMEGQVRSKSGLALKQGLMVLNSPGTIDEGYRGEVCVILLNTSDLEVRITPGQKIAQLVISKYERPPVRLGSVDNVTARGTGGFGSTGN